MQDRLRCLLQDATGLQGALAIALGRAAVEIAADLRATFIDRAKVNCPAVRSDAPVQGGAVAVMDFQIRSVPDEMRNLLSVGTEAVPIGAAYAHVGFKF